MEDNLQHVHLYNYVYPIPIFCFGQTMMTTTKDKLKNTSENNKSKAIKISKTNIRYLKEIVKYTHSE